MVLSSASTNGDSLEPNHVKKLVKSEGNDDAGVTTATWPEEPDDETPWYKLAYRRWTFSYMNRILLQGSRQMRPDGTHLAMEDLYPVPPSMRSALLTKQFLYVSNLLCAWTRQVES